MATNGTDDIVNNNVCPSKINHLNTDHHIIIKRKYNGLLTNGLLMPLNNQSVLEPLKLTELNQKGTVSTKTEEGDWNCDIQIKHHPHVDFRKYLIRRKPDRPFLEFIQSEVCLQCDPITDGPTAVIDFNKYKIKPTHEDSGTTTRVDVAKEEVTSNTDLKDIQKKRSFLSRLLSHKNRPKSNDNTKTSRDNKKKGKRIMKLFCCVSTAVED